MDRLDLWMDSSVGLWRVDSSAAVAMDALRPMRDRSWEEEEDEGVLDGWMRLP